MEYVNGNQERFTDKGSHIEYKRLKKVLKSCRACRGLSDSCPRAAGHDELGNQILSDSEFCQCEACPCMYRLFRLFVVLFGNDFHTFFYKDTPFFCILVKLLWTCGYFLN